MWYFKKFQWILIACAFTTLILEGLFLYFLFSLQTYQNLQKSYSLQENILSPLQESYIQLLKKVQIAEKQSNYNHYSKMGQLAKALIESASFFTQDQDLTNACHWILKYTDIQAIRIKEADQSTALAFGKTENKNAFRPLLDSETFEGKSWLSFSYSLESSEPNRILQVYFPQSEAQKKKSQIDLIFSSLHQQSKKAFHNFFNQYFPQFQQSLKTSFLSCFLFKLLLFLGLALTIWFLGKYLWILPFTEFLKKAKAVQIYGRLSKIPELQPLQQLITTLQQEKITLTFEANEKENFLKTYREQSQIFIQMISQKKQEAKPIGEKSEEWNYKVKQQLLTLFDLNRNLTAFSKTIEERLIDLTKFSQKETETYIRAQTNIRSLKERFDFQKTSLQNYQITYQKFLQQLKEVDRLFKQCSILFFNLSFEHNLNSSSLWKKFEAKFTQASQKNKKNLSSAQSIEEGLQALMLDDDFLKEKFSQNDSAVQRLNTFLEKLANDLVLLTKDFSLNRKNEQSSFDLLKQTKQDFDQILELKKGLSKLEQQISEQLSALEGLTQSLKKS